MNSFTVTSLNKDNFPRQAYTVSNIDNTLHLQQIIDQILLLKDLILLLFEIILNKINALHLFWLSFLNIFNF